MEELADPSGDHLLSSCALKRQVCSIAIASRHQQHRFASVRTPVHIPKQATEPWPRLTARAVTLSLLFAGMLNRTCGAARGERYLHGNENCHVVSRNIGVSFPLPALVPPFFMNTRPCQCDCKVSVRPVYSVLLLPGVICGYEHCQSCQFQLVLLGPCH